MRPCRHGRRAGPRRASAAMRNLGTALGGHRPLVILCAQPVTSQDRWTMRAAGRQWEREWWARWADEAVGAAGPRVRAVRRAAARGVWALGRRGPGAGHRRRRCLPGHGHLQHPRPGLRVAVPERAADRLGRRRGLRRDTRGGGVLRGVHHGTAGAAPDPPADRVLGGVLRHGSHQPLHQHRHDRRDCARRVLRGRAQPVPGRGADQRAASRPHHHGDVPEHVPAAARQVRRAVRAGSRGAGGQRGAGVAAPRRGFPGPAAARSGRARGGDPARAGGGADAHRRGAARRGHAQRQRDGGAGRGGPAGAGRVS